MSKYHFALFNGNSIFDESDFDSIAEGKIWAEGRGRFYNYDGKHYKYKVSIFKYVPCVISGFTLEPLESYLSE